MQHGIKVSSRQNGVHCCCIKDVTNHHLTPLHRFRVSCGKVVKGHNYVALFGEQAHHMTADIARTTAYKNLHLISPAAKLHIAN